MRKGTGLHLFYVKEELKRDVGLSLEFQKQV